MFWLFDTNISESYDFVQIFDLDELVIDSDTVYTLDLNTDTNLDKDTSKGLNLGGTNFLDLIEKNKIKPKIFNYCIKIMGPNISYTNLETSQSNYFVMKQKFIKPTENKFNKPIFEFNYKTSDKSKIPELLSKSYDFYYPNIKFEMFQINPNLFFVKEFNKTNNSKRNYVIGKKN